MIPVTSFAGRTVAVFGLGGSGFASCQALKAGGADVVAADDDAENLAKAGAAVVVNYATSVGQAEAVVAKIEAAGGKAKAFQADVSCPAEARRQPSRGVPAGATKPAHASTS